MSTIEKVHAVDIDPNPFRMIGSYPYVETKIDVLMRSIATVGLWEGVIARRKGNRVQLAFGHHRVEAARRAKISEIPLIIRDLTDEQMLQFMGRENGEDFNADFLCMLETWEAAVSFLGGNPGRLAIARLLGWTRHRPDKGEVPTEVADTCDLAHGLIIADYFDRKTFSGMAVKAVREIVQAQVTRLTQIEKTAKTFKWDTKKIAGAVKATVSSGHRAAKEFKSGHVAMRDLRTKADEFFIEHKAVRNEPALLNMALQPIIRHLNGVLSDDSVATKLSEIVKVLPRIINDLSSNDRKAIDATRLELEYLEGRASKFRSGLDLNKVVSLKPTRLTITKGK